MCRPHTPSCSQVCLLLQPIECPISCTAALYQKQQKLVLQQARLCNTTHAGLERCSRSAARARLMLLQQCLEAHAGRTLVEHVPASVAALLAMARVHHHSCFEQELARLGAALMDCYLPQLVRALLDGLDGGKEGQGLLSSNGLINTIMRPVLKVACK